MTGIIETNEFVRFSEFCDDCMRHKYIGICHGPPGVGKTVSARHYTRWDEAERAGIGRTPKRRLNKSHAGQSIFYTPQVENTPLRIHKAITVLRDQLRRVSPAMVKLQTQMMALEEDARKREERDRSLFHKHLINGTRPKSFKEFGCFYDFQSKPTYEEILNARIQKEDEIEDSTRLIIIDEADWLKPASIDQIRYIHDQEKIGIVLIGMSGLVQKFSRYPQLFQRVGNVYHFRPLKVEQARRVLRDHWRLMKVDLPKTALSDEEGIAAIIRVTRGNFRLMHRVLLQSQSILKLNNLTVITSEVVDATREHLVIGVE